MKPLFFTLHTERSVMILPDTLAHLDGHIIITETYSVFKDTGRDDPNTQRTKESSQHLEANRDPDYLGYIRFEVPDKLFSYSPGQVHRLHADEVEELITLISEVRANPQVWSTE
ncbi:hypothetical protein AAFN85_03195 [Mucilaginibacter sp. CAU 1740]|uniref:hypothetical protein n=1 Tax=Mucilaginibacter sp. CAU 1740 TaxID=3140365 RepID=UPI00325AD284